MLGCRPPPHEPPHEPPALPATPRATRPACHPPCLPPHEQVEKSKKKLKKLLTFYLKKRTLYLSRGTGPLGKVGIPPARSLKGRWKRQEKVVDGISRLRI